MFAPEKIPYAINRYKDEVKRVFGVLESVLSKQEFLVGGKLTIADLSFISVRFPSSFSCASDFLSDPH
jgi:glutathione S-transferase